MANTVFDPRDFGGIGDGVQDDWAALQATLENAKAVDGCVYLPAGVWRHSKPLTLLQCDRKISMRGDGDNVSVLLMTGGDAGLVMTFAQAGQDQPFGLRLEDIGFKALGRAGTAITISYGDPIATSDHFQPSMVIRGVSIVSGPQGVWANGIDVEAAWNVSMTDVFVSGDPHGGNWNALTGAGIRFRRMCVNAHLTNVRMNFWAIGFFYHAGTGGNTEGLFFSNCSMVGVQRGAWIIGNGEATAPRVSTISWTGGMIDCRVGGVTGGSAAFHLQNVWTALIVGCQMITEMIPVTHLTYAIFADNCSGVIVTGCDINAWHYGVYTVGICKAISNHGNTATNVGTITCFNGGTNRSRSFGHVLFNGTLHEEDHGVGNMLGFIGT
jgi:hypothetical protein